jgi:hypothetical protein
MDAIIDDLLIATILAGIGICGAYLRSEYIRYRRHKRGETGRTIS